jgi:pyrroloquinoline quinone biosynthesis protein B
VETTHESSDEAGSPAVDAFVSGPRVRVLGTAQDGGLPHAACSCEHCEAARRDPARERLVASLALVLPGPDRVLLIDATPDVRRQLDRLRDLRPGSGGVARAPVDGVFLTHAHLGHYTGLAFFGFEAVHTRQLPVWATPRMAAFLRDNGPWSQLVEIGNIALRPLPPGLPVEIGEGVSVTALSVPHRDEYADTVGFLLRGPRSTLLYIPDTEPWRKWERSLPALLEEHDVDVALLDGSFFSLDELPGREVSQIGHPLVTDSLDLLEPLVRERGLEVYFTHFNHSNPVLEPDGAARAEVVSRGFRLLEDGAELPL